MVRRRKTSLMVAALCCTLIAGYILVSALSISRAGVTHFRSAALVHVPRVTRAEAARASFVVQAFAILRQRRTGFDRLPTAFLAQLARRERTDAHFAALGMEPGTARRVRGINGLSAWLMIASAGDTCMNISGAQSAGANGLTCVPDQDAAADGIVAWGGTTPTGPITIAGFLPSGAQQPFVTLESGSATYPISLSDNAFTLTVPSAPKYLTFTDRAGRTVHLVF